MPVKNVSPKIRNYDPFGIRLGERIYTDADIDRIIKAAGLLPEGVLSVEIPHRDGTKLVKRRLKRRSVLGLRLEDAAQSYFVYAEHQQKPPNSTLRDTFDNIEASASRLWTALGLDGKPDLESMPYALRYELADQAEAHGQRINGYADMPPKTLRIAGEAFTDFYGRAKLRQALESIALLKAWAEAAKKQAGAQVTKNVQNRTSGNTGDRALNDLLRELGRVWSDVYERSPRTSVGGPGTPNEGIASGPFVRFIGAALMPILRDETPNEDALRARIRRLEL